MGSIYPSLALMMDDIAGITVRLVGLGPAATVIELRGPKSISQSTPHTVNWMFSK